MDTAIILGMERYTSDKAKQSGKAAKAAVKKIAKTLDVTVNADASGGWDEITAEAPQGKVFVASHLHGVVAANVGNVFDGLWESVLRDIQDGVEECTNVDCDVCNDETKGGK